MKKFIIKNKKNIIIFSLYAICTFILIFFHENWRDEAQAWLIARDLNLIEIIQQLKYEGHFLLWYLILMPFAKLGFPYITSNFISWFITCVSVWLILQKAPFKTYKIILFICTFPMLYLFPIISRCYCLIPLAITLIAIFYRNKFHKPIRYILSIVLLSNTHIIMLGLVGILLFDFYLEWLKSKKNFTKHENKQIIISLFVVIVLLTISALPLISCLSVNKSVGYNNSFSSKLMDAIFWQPIISLLRNFEAISTNLILMSIIVILSLIIFIIYFANYKKDFIKLLIAFFWQYLIGAFIYPHSPQRVATQVMIFFLFWWIKEPKNINPFSKKILNFSLMSIVIFNIFSGLLYISYDISGFYSTACQVGEYINNNLSEESILISGSSEEICNAVIPYISPKIKCYYVQGNRYFTYATWDEVNGSKLNDNFLDNIKINFKNNNNLYYLFSKDKYLNKIDSEIVNELVNDKKLIKIFETSKAMLSDEEYILFKVNN